jgi:Flp pilus assembly protein TadG
VALEFAIVSIAFLSFMLGIFEVSYDLFTQAALNAGLLVAIREVETGNTQNTVSANTFITNYLCPAMGGLLQCNSSLLVNIQKVQLSATNDFYAYTTGMVPVAGNTLVVPTSYGKFCNAGANEALLVSVIYIGPTFLGGLLPGIFSLHYGSSVVHATLATKGIITENFSSQPASCP